MNIRFAEEKDIPRMIDLLQQLGELRHQIRSGAQKIGMELTL